MNAGAISVRTGATGGLREALPYLGAWAALAAFYSLTATSNHSLSPDAYWYARMITQGTAFEVEHPRLFLWLASMQGLFGAASLLTPNPDVFKIIGTANAVQAALAVVLLARLMIRDLGVDHVSSWLTAGLFAFTYGMWRYSSEIEIYATASLLAVLLLTGSFHVSRIETERLTAWVSGLAVLGGLSTLVYQPLGLLGGIVLPVFLLFSLGLRSTVTYCGIAGAIVAAGIWFAVSHSAETVAVEGADFILDTRAVGVRVPDLLTPAKLLHGLGYVTFSMHWVLAFQPVQELFAQIAPARSYAAEIYTAEHSGALVWIPLVTLPVAAFLLVRIIWAALGPRQKTTVDHLEGALWLWLALHATMITLISPGSHEPWITAFPAIFALLARRIVSRAVQVPGRVKTVCALLVVMAAHNASVGLGMLNKPDGDYFRNRGEAVLMVAARNDTVIMSADRPLAEYLRFSGMRNVIDIREDGLRAARDRAREALETGHTLWLLQDAVAVPAHVRAESKATAAAIEAFTARYADPARRHALGEADWIYRVEATQ